MVLIFKNKFLLIPLVILFISIGIILHVTNTNNSNVKADEQVELYYPNIDTKILEVERKSLVGATINDKVIETLQYLFETNPANTGLRTLTNGQRPYQEVEIVNNTVIIYFNNIYHNLSNINKMYAKASITWSLTSLDGIKNIMFYDSGELVQLGIAENSSLHSRTNVRLNPVIDPKDTIAVDFKLYFGNNDYTKLVAETQTVYVNPNKIEEEYIVTQLIEGTKVPNNKDVIPQGTKVLKVETENKICYVTLNDEFVSKMPNDTSRQKLAIYSIVNSLTELDNVDSVQILINSKRIAAFENDLDLRNTLSFNEEIVN